MLLEEYPEIHRYNTFIKSVEILEYNISGKNTSSITYFNLYRKRRSQCVNYQIHVLESAWIFLLYLSNIQTFLDMLVFD